MLSAPRTDFVALGGLQNQLSAYAESTNPAGEGHGIACTETA